MFLAVGPETAVRHAADVAQSTQRNTPHSWRRQYRPRPAPGAYVSPALPAGARRSPETGALLLPEARDVTGNTAAN